jgi:hypothetical protein
VNIVINFILFYNNLFINAIFKRYTRLEYILENFTKGAYLINIAKEILVVKSYAIYINNEFKLEKVIVDLLLNI